MAELPVPFRLDGRVAIVTGAAGGIGLAAARVLGEAGAHVVLTDVQGEMLEASTAALTAEGLSCESAVLDVSRQPDVEAIVGDVMARNGRLDVMVNNAAIIDDSSPLTITEATLDRIHAVNFKGVVFGSQAAARFMLEQGSGSIINVTSGIVDIAIPLFAGYSTAKAAAAQYSRGLAMEVAKGGVRVNTLAPGWTDTPMNERHVRDETGTVDPERKADYVAMRAATSPLGLTGEPVDQAYAIWYLASDASRYVTGMVFRVNGGVTMPW
jgi:3-oxoacyl-[acyl-carrier protein] reductase